MIRVDSRFWLLLALVMFGSSEGITTLAIAQMDSLPSYLADRGTGLPSSIFATYIEPGELLVYPFFAYDRDYNREYQPLNLGFPSSEDFRGKYSETQSQIFVGYGFSEQLAVECEASFASASLSRSVDDHSGVPSTIRESGLADIEGQLRVRLFHETETRPEYFLYLEITAPSQKNKVLIGDPEWDLRPGVGVVRGFSWGTVSGRMTIEYNRDDEAWDIGEVSAEYLKQLTRSWRINLAVEGGETGAPDEWDLVLGARWSVADGVFLKFDNAIGFTSKATDWAPQIGFMFTFPGR